MSHVHKNIIDKGSMLREKGFRATKGRLELLQFLEHSGRPLSIQNITALWKGTPPDTATLYRALTDLSSAGVIRRIDLNTGIAHFEYTPDRPHHHHIVCDSCGLIEEIDGCSVDSLQKKILSTSKLFRGIKSHNLEFYGYCAGCAAI